MSKEIRNIAGVTTYIYAELMDSPSFFTYFDEAYKIAVKFVEYYPSDINWEKHQEETGKCWEETLSDFFLDNKTPKYKITGAEEMCDYHEIFNSLEELIARGKEIDFNDPYPRVDTIDITKLWVEYPNNEKEEHKLVDLIWGV